MVSKNRLLLVALVVLASAAAAVAVAAGAEEEMPVGGLNAHLFSDALKAPSSSSSMQTAAGTGVPVAVVEHDDEHDDDDDEHELHLSEEHGSEKMVDAQTALQTGAEDAAEANAEARARADWELHYKIWEDPRSTELTKSSFWIRHYTKSLYGFGLRRKISSLSARAVLTRMFLFGGQAVDPFARKCILRATKPVLGNQFPQHPRMQLRLLMRQSALQTFVLDAMDSQDFSGAADAALATASKSGPDDDMYAFDGEAYAAKHGLSDDDDEEEDSSSDSGSSSSVSSNDKESTGSFLATTSQKGHHHHHHHHIHLQGKGHFHVHVGKGMPGIPAVLQADCGPVCQLIRNLSGLSRVCVRHGFSRLFYYSKLPKYRQCLARAFYRANIELKTAPTQADFAAAYQNAQSMLQVGGDISNEVDIEDIATGLRKDLGDDDEDDDDEDDDEEEQQDASKEAAGAVPSATDEAHAQESEEQEEDLLISNGDDESGKDKRFGFSGSAEFRLGGGGGGGGVNAGFAASFDRPQATIVAGSKGFVRSHRFCWPCFFNRIRSSRRRAYRRLSRRARRLHDMVLAAQAQAISELYKHVSTRYDRLGARLATEVAMCREIARTGDAPPGYSRASLFKAAKERIDNEFRGEVREMSDNMFKKFRKYFENHVLGAHTGYANDMSIYGTNPSEDQPFVVSGDAQYAGDPTLASAGFRQYHGIGGADVMPGVNHENSYDPEPRKFAWPNPNAAKRRKDVVYAAERKVQQARTAVVGTPDRPKQTSKAPIRDPDLRNKSGL